MSKAQASTGNLLVRCFRAPYRALCRARDLYIKSMTGCAGRMHYGDATVPISYPSTFGGSMSRSGSLSSLKLSSGDEDLIELIRAASQSRARAAAAAEGSVRRSQSVAAVRIDEDAPYEFTGEVKVGGSLIFPRSQSHAVGRRMVPSEVTWKYK
ncbi:uncharacterized protein LOC110105616 [Dendrobium catenatum]|uniref:Uncharacterized protein n=1 Tax=Dendrobium catenatum TaxID=906689 RepID=A0A2I0V9D7_9ASPA|nr:uncharacterized protein LOC110105616 [Dendrobium catenatum]PKU60009.1 hypothetical protein MA16_Dca028348 [Dendrobium catenatum]